jgi:hypothetical protein
VAAIDLTTLEKVKNELGGITGTSLDALLNFIITAASRILMTQTGRRFKSAAVTYTTDGTATRGLSLPNGPVTAISTVVIDGTTIPPIVTLGDTGWTQQGDRVRLVGHRFDIGTNNVVVTYTSGYTSIPEDLEQGCIELACWMYKNRDHFGIQQSSTHDANAVTYRRDELPFLVRAVIDSYANVFGMALDPGLQG